MASVSPNRNSMTAEEYLAFELNSDSRHEFIDGQIFAMTGASESHNLIALNFASEIRSQLRKGDSPCKTVVSDMKVKVANKFFYPDVLVFCDQNDSYDYYKESPKLIIEVLSNTTRKLDQTTKFLAYVNIPSLEEYVLVEQDFMEVSVFRRSDNWKATRYFEGEVVMLQSIGATISVAEIYYQVIFEN